jgi:hypothetical protein
MNSYHYKKRRRKIQFLNIYYFKIYLLYLLLQVCIIFVLLYKFGNRVLEN